MSGPSPGRDVSRLTIAVLVESTYSDRAVFPGGCDDGQPDLPGGGHAVLPRGGQRDYSA